MILVTTLFLAAAGSSAMPTGRFADVEWHCHFVGAAGITTDVSGSVSSATKYNSIGFVTIGSGDRDLPEGDHPLNGSIRGNGTLGVDLEFADYGDFRNRLAMVFYKDGSGSAHLSVTEKPSNPDFSRAQIAVLKVGHCRWEELA